MTGQDKTVKVGGYAHATVEDGKLVVTAEGGLVAVAIADLKGNSIWMWHPLTGWYVEIEMNRELEE